MKTQKKNYKKLYENLSKRIAAVHDFAWHFGGEEHVHISGRDLNRALKKIAYGNWDGKGYWSIPFSIPDSIPDEKETK